MDKQAAFWLDALGANGELSATMKHELDTQGYTIVHGVADADWLHAMRERIDYLVELEGEDGEIRYYADCVAEPKPKAVPAKKAPAKKVAAKTAPKAAAKPAVKAPAKVAAKAVAKPAAKKAANKKAPAGKDA